MKNIFKEFFCLRENHKEIEKKFLIDFIKTNELQWAEAHHGLWNYELIFTYNDKNIVLRKMTDETAKKEKFPGGRGMIDVFVADPNQEDQDGGPFYRHDYSICLSKFN